MAEQAKPIGDQRQAAFKPGAIVVALAVSLALILLFGLLSRAHF